MSNQTVYNFRRVDLVGMRLVALAIELSNKANTSGNKIVEAKKKRRKIGEPRAG